MAIEGLPEETKIHLDHAYALLTEAFCALTECVPPCLASAIAIQVIEDLATQNVDARAKANWQLMAKH